MAFDPYKRGFSDGLIAAIIELERIEKDTFDADAKAALRAARENVAGLSKSRSEDR